ncbi:unnamed protein product [Mytilus coruscus]|uniref:Uncharacterized protein n=1 Tax=Mytilus coruscus TaxID=42192 RepID=A0A6J8C6Y1_MYTCO|nr:unnamed protein product [Mytilus coruscus]
MSFAETTKILAESRKILEDGQENNTATLLTLILSVVTSVEKIIKKIESGMESIEKIKTIVTLLSADLCTLTKNLKDLEEKNNTLETSLQAMSDMYDQCKTEYKTSSGQISALNTKVDNLEKKLEQSQKIYEDDDCDRHMESDSAVNEAPPSPLRSPPNNRITPDKIPNKRRRQASLP